MLPVPFSLSRPKNRPRPQTLFLAHDVWKSPQGARKPPLWQQCCRLLVWVGILFWRDKESDTGRFWFVDYEQLPLRHIIINYDTYPLSANESHAMLSKALNSMWMSIMIYEVCQPLSHTVSVNWIRTKLESASMGARRNFSRGGQNHQHFKKSTRFRRAVQNIDHFWRAEGANENFCVFRDVLDWNIEYLLRAPKGVL